VNMSALTACERMARSANNCSQPWAWGKDPSNDLDSGGSRCQRCQVADLAELYPPKLAFYHAPSRGEVDSTGPFFKDGE